MIKIAKQKKFKKTLTQLFDESESFRSLYLNAFNNERAMKNAHARKMKYHSNYYKQAFINNYEEYYRNGGRQSNKYNDYMYKQITGKAFDKNIKPKKSKRKNKK